MRAGAPPERGCVLQEEDDLRLLAAGAAPQELAAIPNSLLVDRQQPRCPVDDVGLVQAQLSHQQVQVLAALRSDVQRHPVVVDGHFPSFLCGQVYSSRIIGRNSALARLNVISSAVTPRLRSLARSLAYWNASLQAFSSSAVLA